MGNPRCGIKRDFSAIDLSDAGNAMEGTDHLGK
jgi:hypothetical protein